MCMCTGVSVTFPGVYISLSSVHVSHKFVLTIFCAKNVRISCRLSVFVFELYMLLFYAFHGE